MNHSAIRQLLAWGLLLLGGAIALYAGLGLYLWLAITNLLYFLSPSYEGLAGLVTLLVTALLMVYCGYRLLGRHGDEYES